MQKHTQRVRRFFGALAQFFILSPRLTEKLYNPFLFSDDKSGKPVTSHPDFDDVQCTQMFVPTAGGVRLNSWFFKHPESSQVLLFNIGRSGDVQEKLRHVRLLLDAGLSVFVFEYRGFGASPGDATVAKICEDGLHAYDFLVERLGFSADDIIIFGESLGAAVAAHTASRRPARALIMQSGFISLERIIKDLVRPLRLVPDSIFPATNPPLNNLALVQKPHPPLLIVHGRLDPVIGVYHAYVLFEGASSTKSKSLTILPNSKHSDLGMAEQDIPLFSATVREFLGSLNSNG